MPLSNNQLTAILSELQRLVEVIAQLRNPEGGCPWDLAQTPQSLTPYILEEAYEAVDAIQVGSTADIAEELGDLLLQVVLQAQVFQDQGDFNLADIARGITDKMIRRHPHVFPPAEGMGLTADSPEAVKRNWEEIKAQEKQEKGETSGQLSSQLKHDARALPPLAGAMKISKKAAKAGFEWDSLEEVWDKVAEEMTEFRHALDHESKEAQESELGDLFFSLIQIARWRGLDPTAALQGTNRRFVRRFEKVEAQASKPLADYSLPELEAFWQKAKQQIAQDAAPPSGSES